MKPARALLVALALLVLPASAPGLSAASDDQGNSHAKVVGSGDQKFQSGDTDLRGILAVDGLVGQATVIVKKGDEYAFYRGSGIHQPQLCVPVQNTPQHRAAPQKADKALKQFDALDNNMNVNDQNRGRQLQWLQQEVYNKKQTGVEVGRTK